MQHQQRDDGEQHERDHCIDRSLTARALLDGATALDSIARRQLLSNAAEPRIDLLRYDRSLHVGRDVALYRDRGCAVTPPDQPLLELIADRGDLRQRDPATALGGYVDGRDLIQTTALARLGARQYLDQLVALTVIGDGKTS